MLGGPCRQRRHTKASWALRASLARRGDIAVMVAIPVDVVAVALCVRCHVERFSLDLADAVDLLAPSDLAIGLSRGCFPAILKGKAYGFTITICHICALVLDAPVQMYAHDNYPVSNVRSIRNFQVPLLLTPRVHQNDRQGRRSRRE